MFNIKNKSVPTPPYKRNDYELNNKVLSEGEDLGEGSARRVIINESTTLSPSPSVLDFLHAQFCRCFLRSASRNFKLRYPELHSVRKSAPKGEGECYTQSKQNRDLLFFTH